MVKQYVGARYVPKFASPLEWAADTSYEALTIVTFNNASYTSKIQVPPTVGNPANNPKYWALTGNYNAQVEQYRQVAETIGNNLNTEIKNLKNADTTEITNRKNADTALQGQITTVSNNLTTEITNRKNADTTLRGNIDAEAAARQTADNTLQSNINSEASTRAAADAALQGQIDNFVQLPSGSTAADAELVNIRVKADGTSATTAGNAVREQITGLKNDLSNLGLITEGHLERDARQEAANFTIYIPVELNAGEYVVGVDGIIGNQAVRKFSFMAAKTLNGADTVKDIKKPIVSGERVIVQLSDEEASRIHYIVMYGTTAEKIDVFISLYGGYYVEQLISNKNNISYLNENGTGIVVVGEYSRAALTEEHRYMKYIPVDLEPGKYAVVVRGTFEEKRTTLRFTAAQSINVADMVIDISSDVKEGVLSYANVSEENAEGIKYLLFSAVTAEPVDITITLLRGDSNLSRLAALEAEQKPLPDYYYKNDWLDTRIAQVKENTKVTSGMSFAFITDIHVPSNDMNSRFLLKEILAKTSIDTIFFGGDIPYAYGTKENMLDACEKWVEYRNSVTKRFFFIRGNHDFTIKTSKDESTGYTAQNNYAYDYIMRGVEDMVHGEPGKLYFYVDYPLQKIRFICIDSFENVGDEDTAWAVKPFISTEQYKWLLNALAVQDYTFVLFSHIPSDTELKTYESVMYPVHMIEKALNSRGTYSFQNSGSPIHADFTDSTSKVACHIAGHCHGDYSHTDENVLTITTTCDAHYNDDPAVERTSGTTTEQAFDVFSIDTTKREIKTVRFGAGENRTWNY